MTETATGGVSAEKTKLAIALAEAGLKNIAETLENDPLAPIARIDEIHIMRQKDDQWDPVFTYTEGGREIDIFDVWALFSQIQYVKHGNVISLDGQEGQSFDFMVMILHKGVEYFVFGNNLIGTLEDLEKNAEWLIAKAQFITLAAALARTVADDE